MKRMTDLKWWQTATFYQIYPRSFADGNGDGIGDFKGMLAKLDYLQSLGIDAIWLSPCFPSPNVDLGYDVSGYASIAPEYGTLDDFRQFLDGAHARGIRVLHDLVVNHTSDQHAWFRQSRQSRDNPKRDWYVWRDPSPTGGPPNNWHSAFGGSAWTLDEATGQYYYHFFFEEQPDLNWRNPDVKRAMWADVRFWLDMGVDGFRLDAVGTVFEDPAYPPHKSTLSERETLVVWREKRSAEELQVLMTEFGRMFEYQMGQPGVHELMKELRGVMDEYSHPERVLIGEDENIAYYGNGQDELHLVFNFPLMRTDRQTPAWVRANQVERLGALPSAAWPCNTLGNHDRSRVKSAYGNGKHDDALARISLALVLTLRGTPVLYNGEEIGMTDLLLGNVEQLRDNQAVNLYHLARSEGATDTEAMAMAARITRDRNRTPMQWANGPNAGFSPAGVVTWLPVNPNYAHGINVADQAADGGSMLNFYRRLLHVRKSAPALLGGDYGALNVDARDYFAFTRTSAEQTCLIVLNMSAEPQTAHFDLAHTHARCLFSTAKGTGEAIGIATLMLASFEIFIGELGPAKQL